ncbi:MAG: DUF1415 family protein, partial [Cognatishimia sp.]|nr:DUF1415 family protein [Cognatishimia sp.]
MLNAHLRRTPRRAVLRSHTRFHIGTRGVIDPYICTCEIVLAGANVVRWERTSPCDSLRIAPKKLELCASCCKPITLPRISHITKPELETLPKPHQDAVKLTQHWLEDMVVGLNLCPFSASVIARDQVYFAVCDAEDDVDLHQFFLSELERLLGTNENEIATSLLIFPQGQEAFDDYLSLLDWFQQLLEQAELTGYVQLASFHP